MMSCSQISYLIEQGSGQLKIQIGSTKNEKVLADPNVSKENKEKIKKIIEYKKFFYKYFKKEETEIYSETYFLQEEAVTYLVSASKFDQIKALKFGFPIVGSFPYIGFFNKESALKKQKELEDLGYITFLRPVYAYTTVGYFEDRILSSFFKFKDENLAELIFHELFHTIFFVKNEVEINENLAMYFSERLLAEYFQWNEATLSKIQKQQTQNSLLVKKLNQWVKKINKELRKSPPKDKEQAQKWLDNFFKEKVFPDISSTCTQEEILPENCFPLKENWNHAKLAQFLTYEKQQDFIKIIHEKHKFTLNKFLKYFKKSYDEFKKSKHKSFKKFLKEKEKL
jgi:predicted aminopeptidase